MVKKVPKIHGAHKDTQSPKKAEKQDFAKGKNSKENCAYTLMMCP